MASYNGLVASSSLNGSTDSQVMQGSSQQNVGCNAAVPSKFFSNGQFAIQVQGISGTVGVQIVGAVGGATFVIAGRTNISGVGGFPVPLVKYVGTSGTFEGFGFPRPSFVSFQGGSTGTIGLTASVFLAAEYN